MTKEQKEEAAEYIYESVFVEDWVPTVKELGGIVEGEWALCEYTTQPSLESWVVTFVEKGFSREHGELIMDIGGDDDNCGVSRGFFWKALERKP